MRRGVTFIGVVLVSLVAVLIPLLVYTSVFIITTDRGTGIAWQRVQPFIPDTLEINSIKGRLSGPLEIRGLTVKTETFRLELDKIELEWMPASLFRRLLDIERLALVGMRYTQMQSDPAKPAEQSEPFILPEEVALPFGVRLRMVNLQNLEFRAQSDAEPLVFNSATLSANTNPHQVDISKLNIESPLFTVEGTLQLATDRNYTLGGELHWRIPVPDFPTITSRTQLKGSLRDLIINQSLAKPYDMQAMVLVKNPLDNLTFEAELKVHPLNLQALNHEFPPITLQLGATGKGDLDDIAFNLTSWVEEVHLGRVNTHMTAGFKSQQLTIDEFKITVPDQSTQLTASGQIALIGEQLLNLTVNWQQLQWPMLQAKIKSPKGHAAVAGNLKDYTFDIGANIVVPEQTDAELFVQGTGSQEAVDLSRIDIRALDGRLYGRAQLSWLPEIKGAVEFTGQGLNPGALQKDWPGKLGITLTAQGGIKDNEPSVQLQELRVQGQLRGYQLSLEAEAAYEERMAILKRLALSSGATRLDARGKVTDTFDLSWKVQSEDLGTLLPNVKGSITGQGALAGNVRYPQVSAELIAEDLEYADYSLKSLDFDAGIDLTGENLSKVSLALKDGGAAGVEISTITLNGQGDLDDHSFTLVADTSRGQADIELQGNLYNPWLQDMAWNFRLERATLKYPDLGGWSLQSPSSGTIAAAQKELLRSCWQSGEASLCLNGQQSIDAIKANFELKDLPFSYLDHYLPPDIKVQGSMNGKGSFFKSGRKEPMGTVDLNTTEILLLLPESGEEGGQQEGLVVELQPGDIRLEMAQGGLQANLALPLTQTDGIRLQANVFPGNSPLVERPLNGRIKTEIKDLAFIADLIPEVQELKGRLTGDIALSGSLASPMLNGRMALTDGSASLERPGLNLKNIGVELSGEVGGGLRLTAQAVSEEGVLNIDGTADLPGKPTRADIKVIGNNFRVINTPEASVDVSPNLTIALRGKRMDVDGEMVFPRAKIKLKALPESAVKVSEDQVIVLSGQQQEIDKPTARETYARVRVVLGDNVSFDGFGLKAQIKGNILAVEKPGEPTTASGELMVVDGEYRAYGQGLVIEKGLVLFAGGPIDQPGLDVRAVRRPAEDILVGVLVRGNLRQPDFTLFSEPSMTQGNQLSYLVLGRPLGGNSGSEGSALSRAALALGLKGGDFFAGKIGSKLGFDQFGVNSGEAGSGSTPQKASFVVGKYLSPKMYVSYGLGLFDPISTIRLQYAISSRWELVTESSSAASGGDIIYTIETGK